MRRPPEVVVAGVDVRPGPDCLYAADHCDGQPLAASPATSKLDLSPWLASALASAELPAADSTVAVFIAGPAAEPGAAATSSRGEVVRAPSSIAAIARAAAAVAKGDCEIAVALALGESSPGDPVASAALTLCRASLRPPRLHAAVRYAVERPPAGDPRTRLPLLLTACAGAGVNPHELTLLDVQPPGPDGIKAMLEAVAFALARGGETLPHCTLAPAFAPSSALLAMIAACAHVRALERRVLPPIAGDEWSDLPFPFCAHPTARPWIAGAPRCSALWSDLPETAGVVFFEQAAPAASSSRRPLREQATAGLLLLAAADRSELAECVRKLRSGVRQESPGRGPQRAALVVRQPAELDGKIDVLLRALSSSAPSLQTPDGVFFDHAERLGGATAMLFPGQGSQYVGMFGDLCLEVPELQLWFERVHELGVDAGAPSLGLLLAPPRHGASEAQRAALERAMQGLGQGALLTMASSVGLFRLLRRVGVRADAVAGYSNGENAAFVAAGIVEKTADVLGLMRLIHLQHEHADGEVRGAALAVNRAERELVEELVAASGGLLHVALDNCPDQLVLFGDPEALASSAARLRAAGALALPLAFVEGHHTPLFAPCMEYLRPVYHELDFARARLPLYSASSAAPFPGDPAAAAELAVHHWVRPVRFRETIERMHADGVRCFVEVGPGATLTGFVRNTLKGRPHVALAANTPGRSGVEQWLQLLGRLHVLGHDVDLARLESDDDGASAVAPPAAAPTVVSTLRTASLAAVPERAAAPAPPPLPTPRPPLPAPPVPIGTAGEVLVRHFHEMGAFLDSQERVQAQLVRTLARTRAPTVAPVAPSTPSKRPPAAAEWPLLGEVVALSADRLETRRTLRPDRDRFLWQHALGATGVSRGRPGSGLPVVPFSFSVELIAEAAACLAGWPSAPLTFSRLRAGRWLAVDGDALELRVVAERVGADGAGPLIRVRIFDDGEVPTPAFEALVSRQIPPAPPPILPAATRRRPQLSAEEFNDALFHGPLFRTLRTLDWVDDERTGVTAVAPALDGVLADELAPSFLVPVALLDAVGQLPGVWLAECGRRKFAVFPVEWERFVQTMPPLPPGSTVHLVGQFRLAGAVVLGDVDMVAADGRVIGRADGLRARVFDYPEPYFGYLFRDRSRLSQIAADDDHGRCRSLVLADGFLAQSQAIWLRVVARIALSRREAQEWQAVAPDRRERWLAARLLAKELALDVLERRGVGADPRQLETRAEGARVEVSAGLAGEDGAMLVAQIEDTAEGLSARVTTAVGAPSRALAGREVVV